jgi:hypothetical protein
MFVMCLWILRTLMRPDIVRAFESGEKEQVGITRAAKIFGSDEVRMCRRQLRRGDAGFISVIWLAVLHRLCLCGARRS